MGSSKPSLTKFRKSSFTNAMAVYAANLTTTDARLRNLDDLSACSILASMTKKFGSAPFDVLAVDRDLRELPLSMRKMNLKQLLARRLEGIFVNPWRVAMALATTITRG